MGKNLRGRECGKGICQRKDGKYSARYIAKDGSRREKHFATLPEARNWIADLQYEDKHNMAIVAADITVDGWFDYWMVLNRTVLYGTLKNTYFNVKLVR